MAGIQLPKIKQLIQNIENAVGGAENYAAGVANTVGKTVGQMPIINGMPNSPKIADATNALAMGQQTPANTLAQGKATPGDLTSDALILAGAPEAKAEDIGNGTTFTRMGGAKAGNAGPPGYLKAKPAIPESAQPKYAGTKTSKLSQDTEKFSNEPTTQLPPINNQTGWQEFSDQQKNYTPNPAQKAIRQISPKDFIHDNDPVGTTNAVHETLDRMDVTNPSAEEQLSVLPAKRQQLYKEAQDKIAADPDNAPIQTIKNNINAELSTQTRLKDISKPAAQKALWDYTQNLYTQATGGKLNGQTIPYSTLFDMKTLANRDYAAVQKKLNNGQPLNDTDKVNAAYRNGLDKTISTRYPGVKQDTMDMSNLYKAQGPLTKAIPKYEAPPQPTSNWEKAKDFGTALGGVGLFGTAAHQLGIDPIGGAVSAYHLAKNAFDNITKGQSDTQSNEGINGQNGTGNNNSNYGSYIHGASIAQPIRNVNDVPNVLADLNKGHDVYGIQSPDSITGVDGQTIGLSYNAYQNQRQQLITKYSQQKVNDPNGAAVTQGQIDNLDAKYKDPQNQQLQKDYQTSQTAENAMNTAATQLKTVSPDMSQAFGTGNFSWDAIRNSTDPKYNALKQSLNNIIAEFPQAEDQLNKAKTQQGLQNIIDASHIALLNKYYSGINTASGGTTADGQPVSTQSQVPVVQAAPQPAPDVNIKGWGMQLPPIQ